MKRYNQFISENNSDKYDLYSNELKALLKDNHLTPSEYNKMVSTINKYFSADALNFDELVHKKVSDAQGTDFRNFISLAVNIYQELKDLCSPEKFSYQVTKIEDEYGEGFTYEFNRSTLSPGYTLFFQLKDANDLNEVVLINNLVNLILGPCNLKMKGYEFDGRNESKRLIVTLKRAFLKD